MYTTRLFVFDWRPDTVQVVGVRVNNVPLKRVVAGQRATFALQIKVSDVSPTTAMSCPSISTLEKSKVRTTTICIQITIKYTLFDKPMFLNKYNHRGAYGLTFMNPYPYPLFPPYRRSGGA